MPPKKTKIPASMTTALSLLSDNKKEEKLEKKINKKEVANIIKNIETCIQNGRVYDKYINKLRAHHALDELIDPLLPTKSRIPGKTTLLMWLIFKKDYSTVRELLRGEHPASPLKQNEKGQFPLWVAIEFADGDFRIVDELLKYQPEKQVVLKDDQSHTALFRCVVNKDLLLVRKILAIGNPAQQVLEKTCREFLPIHTAAYEGRLDIVQCLLQYASREQINAKAEDGCNVLHLAFQSKNLTLIKWLMDNYADCVNQRSVGDRSMLYIASSLKNVPLINLLLENTSVHAQLTVPDAKGFIPLSNACNVGNNEIVNALLSCRPKDQMIYEEPEGYSALLSACYYGHLDIVQRLLGYIARSGSSEKEEAKSRRLVAAEELLLKRTHKGNIALHIAVSNPHQVSPYPSEIIDELLRYIPDQQQEVKNCEGQTPLFIASSNNNIGAVRKLLACPEAKNQLTQTTNDENFPLFVAAQKGFVAIVNLLLTHDAERQLSQRINGWSAVHVAAEEEQLFVIKEVIKLFPVQINARNQDGFTPLHVAIYFKKNKVIKFLLADSRTNRLLADSEEFLPVHVAAQVGDTETLSILLSTHTVEQLQAKTIKDAHVMHLAVSSKKLSTIKYLIEHYSSNKAFFLNAQDNGGRTALHLACLYGFTDIVAYLIHQDADLNAVTLQNWTPLHVASYQQNGAIIDLLIKRGAELNKVNDLLSTPLHIACERGHLNVVNLFCQRSIDVNLKDKYGRTSLVCAVLFEHHHLIQPLIHKGADANVLHIHEGQAFTPLTIAIELLDLEAVKLLVALGADPRLVVDKERGSTAINFAREEIEDSEVADLFLKALNVGDAKEDKEVKLVEESKKITLTTSISSVEIKRSGRKHLESLGYSLEEIADFEKDRQEIQATLKQQKKMSSSLSMPERKIVSGTWFNNLFSSRDKGVYPILNSDLGNAYCYVDEKILAEQGCCFTNFHSLTYRLSNRHIKKLNKDVSSYEDLARFPEGELKVHYTHELKINRMDRVLLFELPSDNKGACLYVGARYVSSGLHVLGNIKALKQSGKARECLQLVWPGGHVIESKEEAKSQEKRKDEEEKPKIDRAMPPSSVSLKKAPLLFNASSSSSSSASLRSPVQGPPKVLNLS